MTDSVHKLRDQERMPALKQVATIAFCLATVAATTAVGSSQIPVPLTERTRGAERVVVGRVASVTPEWQVNEYGDRLIVSVVRVDVSETLKGDAAPTVDVEVEGGTIGTLTLRVSDQLSFTPGE